MWWFCKIQLSATTIYTAILENRRYTVPWEISRKKHNMAYWFEHIVRLLGASHTVMTLRHTRRIMQLCCWCARDYGKSYMHLRIWDCAQNPAESQKSNNVYYGVYLVVLKNRSFLMYNETHFFYCRLMKHAYYINHAWNLSQLIKLIARARTKMRARGN